MKFSLSKFAHTVAGKARHGGGFKILTTLNDKTPKGEKAGYLTAVLYLSPHTLVAPKSLCPHSTEACRETCLYTAGRGAFDNVRQARERRTRMFIDNTEAFLGDLIRELTLLQAMADKHDMGLAVRLNGTSDVRWEFVVYRGGTVFDYLPRAIFYDYTRFPSRHRHVPKNWKLTFSLADAPVVQAWEHLEAGRNVAAIVPTEEREDMLLQRVCMIGGRHIALVDGERDDLRFRDPEPALILLKPKGKLRRGGRPLGDELTHPMVRENLIADLRHAAVWGEEMRTFA